MGLDLFDLVAVLQREGGVIIEDFAKGIAIINADYKVVGADVVEEVEQLLEACGETGVGFFHIFALAEFSQGVE